MYMYIYIYTKLFFVKSSTFCMFIKAVSVLGTPKRFKYTKLGLKKLQKYA